MCIRDRHNSLEGLIYTVNDDGTYTLTQDGQNRFTADVQIPEELGGGLWSDGNNQVNQWIVGSAEMNPVTGEYFEPGLWASMIKLNQTATTEEWTEKFGAVNEVEYMRDKNQLGMVANVNIPLASDDTDTALIRSQCKSVVCDASWRMVFAASDEEMCIRDRFYRAAEFGEKEAVIRNIQRDVCLQEGSVLIGFYRLLPASPIPGFL